jgi:hypothetical protein
MYEKIRAQRVGHKETVHERAHGTFEHDPTVEVRVTPRFA